MAAAGFVAAAFLLPEEFIAGESPGAAYTQ